MQDEVALRALLCVLANCPSGDTVARAVADAGLPDLDVHAVALHALRGQSLDLLGAHGIPPARGRLLEHIPADAPAPEQRTIAVGESVAYAHTALGALPLHRHLDSATPGLTIMSPLRLEGRIIGLLTVQTHHVGVFDAALQRRIDGIGAALSLWIGTRHPAPPPALDRPLLNARQRRVIDGIRRGLTNAAIAAELGFAVGTIKADITAMSAMFGASGRLDLLQRVDAAFV